MDPLRGQLPPRFDAGDPAVREDPYPAYAALRRAAPLCRGGPGQWAVTRHADVAALLGDPRLGNRFPDDYHRFSLGDGPASDFLQRIVLHQDRPHHARLRRVMSWAFSPRVVSALRPRIGELVDGLLAPACDRGLLEAVDDLAFPLPVMVVCELIGIPSDDRQDVRARAFDLGKAFASRVPEPDRVAADAAVVWMRDYIRALIHDRPGRGDDLLSRMLDPGDGADQLSEEEVVDNVVFLFFAGFETTTSMIATGCAALLDHPDELARLREDRSLVPSAVEEFLRWDAPIQSRLRLVLDPIEVHGRTIRPGRALLLLLGSANHDERVFPDAGRLDIGRSPNPHVSFGGGFHHCLGAALARAEGVVVFERLLARFGRLEPAGQATREMESPFRTFSRIPIAVRAA